MKKVFSALFVLALATPAAATPQSPDYINGGQCAGDAYSKCRYTLEIVNPDETMVVVPGLEFVGPSRLSTVEHCASIEGLNDWRQLITDHDFEAMHACLVEHT
jgi:hypothetical protein